MAVANTLAYYNTAIITSVKIYAVQALVDSVIVNKSGLPVIIA